MFNLIFIEEGYSPIEAKFDGENLKTSKKIDRAFAARIKESFEGINTRGITGFRLPNRVAITGMEFVTEGLNYLRVPGKGQLFHEHGNYYFITDKFLEELRTSEGRGVHCGHKVISMKDIEKDATGKITLTHKLEIPTIVLLHALGRKLLIKSIEIQDLNGVRLSELYDNNSYILTDSSGLLYKVDMLYAPDESLSKSSTELNVIIQHYAAIMNMDDSLRKNLEVLLETDYSLKTIQSF